MSVDTGDAAPRQVAVWFVYIIETKCGVYYTGITTDIERRFQEHCDMYAKVPKAKGAKFFRGHCPSDIVYREQLADRASASRREREIKSWSREQKQQLIATARQQ